MTGGDEEKGVKVRYAVRHAPYSHTEELNTYLSMSAMNQKSKNGRLDRSAVGRPVREP